MAKTVMKEKIAYYCVLAASFLLLLSVIIPHHHYSNGLPCIEWIFGVTADHHSHNHAEDTGCTDHNQALNLTIDKHLSGHDLLVLLSPLLILFEYSNQNAPLFLLLFNHDICIHKEFIHDIWLCKAKGFRAPPLC